MKGPAQRLVMVDYAQETCPQPASLSAQRGGLPDISTVNRHLTRRCLVGWSNSDIVLLVVTMR